MSRGHGAVQKRILKRLKEIADRHGLVWVLATDLGRPEGPAISATEPTKAERQSRKRAIQRLNEEGLVEVARVQLHGRNRPVARLRDRKIGSPVDARLDMALYSKMRAQAYVYNQIAAALGSRIRLSASRVEGPTEMIKVIDPETGDSLNGYYIYDQSSTQDLPIREDLIERTLEILGEHIDAVDDLTAALLQLAIDRTPDDALE